MRNKNVMRVAFVSSMLSAVVLLASCQKVDEAVPSKPEAGQPGSPEWAAKAPTQKLQPIGADGKVEQETAHKKQDQPEPQAP